MSLIINSILDPNDVGTVSSGNLGLFAGPGDTFYIKKSSGTYSPISTTSGFNSSLIFNTFSYVLSITDGNSTQTASLIDLASGYFNSFLSVSTSSNVLTLIDGYSTLTASLAYYAGGFNTGISYNTASNVLSITDGNSTVSATLSLTGANTSFTFNPFNNVLSIVDGFSTKTASLALLSGNTGLSFSGGVLTLQDGRGTLTASIPTSNTLDSNLYSTGTTIIGGTTSGILYQNNSGKVSQSNNFLWNSSQNQFVVGTTSYRGSPNWTSSAGTASLQFTTYATYSFSLRNRNGYSMISVFDTGHTDKNKIVINDHPGFFDIETNIALSSPYISLSLVSSLSTSELSFAIFAGNYNTHLGIRGDGRIWHGLFAGTTANYLSQHTIYDSYNVDLLTLISGTSSTKALKVQYGSFIDRFGFGVSNTTFELSSTGTASMVDLKVFDGISIKTGSNKSVGTVSLVGGSASVINSQVNPNSIILVTKQNSSSADPISSVEQFGGSFSIFSSSPADTSTVGYLVINTY